LRCAWVAYFFREAFETIMTVRQSFLSSNRLGAELVRAARISFVAGALLSACGGTATTAGGSAGSPAAGNGGASAGSGGTHQGGRSSGGTHQGGSSTGGASSGGAHQGGSSSGGASHAGSGGADIGGEGGASGEAGAPESGGSGGTAGSGGTGNTCDTTKTCCPTLKCVCPYPAGNGTDDAISDLEAGKTLFKPTDLGSAAGYWDFSRDVSQGTTSPTGTATLAPVDGGANGTTKALHVTGSNLSGWGAALAAILSNGCPFDASKYGGFSFYAKGTSSTVEGANKLLVLAGNPEYIPQELGGFCDDFALDQRCYARHRVLIDLKPDWKQYVITWADLLPAPYGNPLPFGPDRVRDIIFSADGPAKATDPATSFDLWIDELAFVPIGTKSSL